MAGAMVGALHGASWIPARWYDNIENGVRGRDEIVALARRLARLDVRTGRSRERRGDSLHV
jgi:ADP-ribosylglycohydrolase